jgi:hypothetical protein
MIRLRNNKGSAHANSREGEEYIFYATAILQFKL